MGLDTTHGCWHGAYSAFTRWRNALARHAGYALAKGEHGIEFAAIDWDSLPSGSLLGEWERTPDDPLLVLLAHSDCDGVIRPAQAGLLADRLEGLLPKLRLRVYDSGHIGNWEEKTRAFIEGLREAAAAGEDVEFY
jgi:hypothetical protein